MTPSASDTTGTDPKTDELPSLTSPSSQVDTDAPGGPGAVSRGCCCSVLANSAYRTAAGPPLIDPDCTVHSSTLRTESSASAQ